MIWCYAAIAVYLVSYVVVLLVSPPPYEGEPGGVMGGC
jgi:hypothetical protein